MRLVYRPEVDREVREAALWYDAKGSGLSGSFLRLVRLTLEKIGRHPDRFPVVYRDIRRVLTPKPFPYKILYFVDEERDRIVVLAILHQARDPQRWAGRR